MVSIDLTPEEQRTFREVIETAVSDLGMEIAGTDSLEYRNRLKARRDVLAKVLAALGA